MKLFISYSWQDVPLRRAIVAELRSKLPIEVLFDQEGIQVSDALHPKISSLLDEARVVVAILTPSGLDSKEVQDELVRANERKKRIIPLVEESTATEQLPHFLQDVLQIRYTNRTFDQAIDSLVGAIGKLNSESETLSDNINWKSRSKISPTTVKDFGNLDLVWLQRSNLGRELLEQVIAMCAIFPFSWRIGEHLQTTTTFIAPNTFIPDDWTRSFLAGIISKQDALKKAKTVVEIGVGTGIVPVALSQAGFDFQKYYGFDVDTLATRVANINIGFYRLTDRVALRGGGSIFEPERSFDLGRNYADLVIANVPQVPSMSTGPIRDLFDYYHMPVGLSGREREWAMQGLWLVAEILKEGRSRLQSGGSVILNVGGRPGEEHTKAMFTECGYKSTVISTEIVEQDQETDISALVHFERTQGVTYEFYSDTQGTAKITARAAYDRIEQGQKAYHKLHVIEARPEH